MSNSTLTSFERRALVLAQLILSTEAVYQNVDIELVDFSEAEYREYKRKVHLVPRRADWEEKKR
jgi:hypothetical protein